MSEDSCNISFHPLTGANDKKPFSYILQVDDFSILLDCGWSASFDPAEIEPIIKECPRIGAVLISHPTMEHMGALPYLCRKKGLDAPVFATRMATTLGSFLLYDHYRARKDEVDFDLFNVEDIKQTFNQITQLTFEQEYCFPNNGIIIKPFPAGRTLGGASWLISKGNQEILYMVSICIHNGEVIDGFQTSEGLHPTLVIVDARGPPTKANRQENRDFFPALRRELMKGRNALFPVDGPGRGIEILYTISNELLKGAPEQSSKIYFLAHASAALIRATQTNAEFLARKLRDQVNNTNKGAMEMPNVIPIESLEELPDKPEQPGYIIVATDETLDHGFSHQCFMKMSERSIIALTQFAQKGNASPTDSLAENLRADLTHRQISFVEETKEILTGQELDEYRAQQIEAELQKEQDVSDSGDESDDDEDISADINPRLTSSINSSFMFRFAQPGTLTDYGLAIRQEDYAKGAEHAVTNREQIKIVEDSRKSVFVEPDEVPSKYVVRKATVNLQSTVLSSDMQAYGDHFSISGQLQKMSPAQVVVIGGTKEATDALANTIRQRVTKEVSCPNAGDNFYLMQDNSTRKVGLSRSLYNRLHFQKIDNEQEIAFINASYVEDEQQLVPCEKEDLHQARFFGKVELNELSERLKTLNVQTTNNDGCLYCGPFNVKVKIFGDSNVSVTGMMCRDFIIIRNVLQEQLPMI